MARQVAVVAIGGNSLIKDADHTSVDDQYDVARQTMRQIVHMIEDGWEVVLTHGNGPQVGFFLRSAELSLSEQVMEPLDGCGADSQGSVGYILQRALCNELKEAGIDKPSVAVVTQTIVDQHDPTFSHPSKPIGAFMGEELARQRMDGEGWHMVEDSGRGWRRIVPSPKPVHIVEAPAIKTLVDAGFIVIGVGGGGIPVIVDERGDLQGVEGVIDKDLGTALLAKTFKADLLLISTAVEKVSLNFNTPDQKEIDAMTVAEAKRYLEEGHFAPGSMRPKIEAAIDFIEQAGGQVLITDPDNIVRALRHETGTWITPD